MPRLCVYLSESELPNRNPPSKYKHKDGPRSVIFSPWGVSLVTRGTSNVL